MRTIFLDTGKSGSTRNPGPLSNQTAGACTKRKVQYLFFITILFLFSITTAGAALQWYEYEEGMIAAGSMEKPVILDFYADWCGPCIAMEEGTYPDPKVISELSDFVAIKVDTQKRIDIETKYGIAYYPTVVFLDRKGREVSRHIGYLGPEEMVREIKLSREKLPKESPGLNVLYAIAALLLLVRKLTWRTS